MSTPEICAAVAGIGAEEFNKIALGVAAIVALFLGPFMQWLIARRQFAIQSSIAERQATTLADITARQLETQQQIARRQIADSIATKRQAWIDELRRDTAEYLKLAGAVWSLRRPNVLGSPDEQKKREAEIVETTRREGELGIRIQLRLNPTEQEHKDLVKLFAELKDACAKPKADASDNEQAEDMKNFGRKRYDVVDQVQKILKSEWERVKRGEL
jgi:phage tail sheath gpL-like